MKAEKWQNIDERDLKQVHDMGDRKLMKNASNDSTFNIWAIK